MRRTDHGHIRKLACGLVGLSDRAAWRVEPHSRPTAATASRLAVIWAGMQDPTLMSGSLRNKSPERVEAAMRLLSDGAEFGVGLDLLDNVVVPLRCGRATHRIALRPDDSVELLSHPDFDLELERIAVSLGGDAVVCVQEVERRVSAAEPWSLPPAASEVLAFVRVCRSWLRNGFALSETGHALDHGLRHEDLAAHLEAGLDIERAIAWRGIPPDKALAWSELGFSPVDRTTWRRQGRTLDEARSATGIGGERVMRWAAVLDPSVPAHVVGEWAAWGEPTGVWGQLASQGLRVADVPGWVAAFTPVDVLVYVRSGMPLDEALRWKQYGYRPSVATGFFTRGISLEEAWALRSYPARLVQQVWPRTGSVEAVVHELEHV